MVDEQVGGQHSGFEPVVDALSVHGVDQAGRVADRHPPRAMAPMGAHRQPPGPSPFEIGAQLPFVGDESAV